ncbi:MAG: hypothetical protein HY580_05490 [Nitrospinae bacterium]|nr:hypothetical protein [Nitrospinota bacterium]
MEYKTLFIVDPAKSERIQLAKFVKHEKFTVLTFVALADCFKRVGILNPDLIVYVLRKGKTETQHMSVVKDKHKNVPFILVTTPDTLDVNLVQLKDKGFAAVHKAGNNEKVREIVIELLAPDGLAPRTETPHPVPHGFQPLPSVPA